MFANKTTTQKDIKNAHTIKTRKVAIIAMYSRLCIARRDSISNVTSFTSELQTNLMPFHLESLRGATIMPHRGPVLSRLWTKVHEILRRRRRPLVLANAFPIASVTFHSADIRH